MDFSTILQFIKAHPKLIVSVCCGLAFFVFNIIQAIRSHSLSKLKAALLQLPRLIKIVEDSYESSPIDGLEKGEFKKLMVQNILNDLYGRLYTKNTKVFDDAIEDILSAPQKKGGSLDVSQKNEEK